MTIDKPSRGLFLLLLAIILYLTLMPAPPHVPLDDLPMGDKIEHALAFATLMLAARLGFPGVSGWRWLEHLSFLGALIEVAQSGVGRDCDWRDWVADTAGALAMLLAIRVVARLRAPKSPSEPVTLH